MSLFSPKQNQVERYNAIRTTAAILGLPFSIVFGQGRIAGKLIDYNDFTVNKAKQQGGKGLAKGGSQYVYTASIIAALGEGPLNALLNVWDSTGRFVLISASETYTITSGPGLNYTTQNASVYGNDQGVAMVTPYSVGPFTDYGSPGPVTLSGNQNVPMTQVGSSPATGQYTVNPATGVYGFSSADIGKVVIIGYSFYRYRISTRETTIVPFSGPFTVLVDNSPNYLSDGGVVYFPSGTALTLVAGSPGVGQYSHSGATYTFNSGDSGQAIAISYTYKDPNTDTNAPTTLNLTLVSGVNGQSPLSYMTGKHPGKALGYSGISYIFSSGLYLGYTPELPNYSYEVAGAFQVGGGIVDANPADCITALLTNPSFGVGLPTQYLGSLAAARQCWAANGFFISPVIEHETSCASEIGSYLEAGMVGAFFSEGQLKFVPYSDTTAVGNGVTYSPSTTPIAAFTDDDFIPAKNDAPIKIARSAWQDRHNRVQVSYSARVNDYNPELVYEQDDASILRFGLRIEDAQQWDFITTLVAAQYAASMRVQRNVYIPSTYQFRLKSRHSYIEPMDVVTIPDPVLFASAIPVRITKVEDDPEGGLDVTAEDFIWGVAAPAFNPKAVNAPYVPDGGQADPGSIATPVIFEATSRVNQALAYQLWFGVAGQNPNWGGCHVWISRDNINFTQISDILGNQAINAPARMGVTTTALPYNADPDTTDSVTVNLSESAGQLASGTAADADNLATLCLIDSGMNAELFSYQNATLVGSSTYQLGTRLRRGQLGTTISAHAIGVPFLRIDNAVFKYQLDPTYLNQPLYFKFTSFNLYGNQEQSLANVPSYSFTPTGLQSTNFPTPPQSVIIYAAATNAGATQSLIRVNDSSGFVTRQDSSQIPIAELIPFGVGPVPSLLHTVAGGSLGSRTEFFKLTVVDAIGRESLPCAEQTLSCAASTLSQVLLNAPAGYVGAVGYNVYAATTSAAEKLQNAVPIAFGVAWNEPTSGLTATGVAPPSSDDSGEPVPAAPSLSQTAGGALASRSRFVRVAFVRNGYLYGISPESSLTVSASNLLVVTSPTASPGYDGWVPIVGSSTGLEVQQPSISAGLIPFGTNWTEPTTGAAITGGTFYSDDGVQGGLHLWGLNPGGAYYLYPYYNPVTGLIELPKGGIPTAASQAAVAAQNALGNIPLSSGAIVITVPAGGGGSGGGSGGGGGRNFY